MPKKGSQPELKDQELYEKLREDGNSKVKSARISNAAAAAQNNSDSPGTRAYARAS